MTIAETRISVWEALAGRAPGVPTGPADPGLWRAVVDRLNPAKARPVLRPDIEDVHLVSARSVPYVMLRSPDRGESRYLRLTPDEWRLALLCDGSRTVARLVAEFAKISGKLAPDQVTRVIADLAANRMLQELPVDAFRPIQHTLRLPWPVRLGRGMLAFAQGRRVVLASVDPLVGALYKGGGRFLFTRVGAVLSALVALVGIGLFVWTWATGAQAVFLTGDSYIVGALVLLGLNVVALACHELGHALATKHAGRRVPVAGFLVYFGIPSVFVDTTDVWMAGRRARIVTTAAGPAAGLVLAGLAQLLAVVYPPAAPWAFKLCFAWYLNALFNLNPFLALDGYYLLMDWLEVPNLRARGLAWVVARVRRRPPRFAQLDREGRLVALYGMLAVVWLVIAANLTYRIYTDRVAGLITGLWRSGWPARVLLVAVVAGLLSPLCYALAGWSARRVRRFRAAVRERNRAADAPRRLAALRESSLGRLPVPVLVALAEQARWVHPRTGQHLVFAGAAQPDVFVVVDGAVEGRRPNDPSGLVRERVGPGGVVGLAGAVTGAPAALTWITAGTTLLAVPAPAVAGAIGPVSGPPPAERAELDALLAESPALAGLTGDDRLAMAARSKPATWAPGAPVTTADPTDAVVVAAGVVTLSDGTDLQRGALIGPRGEGQPAAHATARTPVRTWTLPAVGGTTLLLGTGGPPSTAGATAPTFGAHPPAAYPPLAAPPGAPPPVDEDADGRFERKLWWLLLLLLVFALGVTTSNIWPGPAWAEMPTDRAMLTGLRGTTVAVVDGKEVRLAEGDEVYVSAGDTVTVARRSGAWLTFRGGARTVLCAGSAAGIGELASTGSGPTRPSAALRLDRGRALVDTGATSAAFAPLAMALGTTAGPIANTGDARWITEPQATVASVGAVRLAGDLLPTTETTLDCGDGVALPVAGTAAPTTDPPATSASPVPSLTPPPSSSTTTRAAPDPTRGPTRGPTTTRPDNPPNNPPQNPPQNPPTTTTSPPPPADRTPPAVSGETGGTIGDPQCWEGGTTAGVFATATDAGTGVRSVVARYTFAISGRSGQVTLSAKGSSYSGSIGPFSGSRSDRINVTVVATDRAGNTASARAGTVSYVGCSPTTSPTVD